MSSTEESDGADLLERDRGQQWRDILNDPNSSKELRDFAQSHVNDSIGVGKIFSGTPELKFGQEEDLRKLVGAWGIVEDFEEGRWKKDDEYGIVSAAANIILEKEGDDGKEPICLRLRGMQGDNSIDCIASYPKICNACNRVINDSNTDGVLKSNAYVVLGFLQGYSSLENMRGDAINNIKKAVKMNPTDWRLHAMLATRNMAIFNTTLSLESIRRAKELTSDQYAKFDLAMREGKILFNLGRNEEAIDTFEGVISLYDNGMKNHHKMNHRVIGRLAVAEYMLVTGYGLKGKSAKVANHYRNAERKRNSIDIKVAKAIDWTSRTLATAVVSEMHPGFVSHGECHQCKKVTDNPKRCTACKSVFYCSKECQSASWKNGHNKQCKTLKAERDNKKADDKKEYVARKNRSKLPPLDVNLDPKSLWKEGIRLSKSGHYEDSAWKFLLALFMDAALDANNMDPVKNAVHGCVKDNPVAMALSPILAPPERRFDMYAKMYEQAATKEPKKPVEMSVSLNDVDRNDFAHGMSHIMYARKIGIIFSCKSAADARRTETKVAFDNVARIVLCSSAFIDPQRWLTQQFELGYSSMDVGAIYEAEKWLNQFMNTLGSTDSLRSNRGVIQHWTKMKSSAEARLSQLPLLKSISKQNPGMLQECETGGDECAIM